jgi:hypothetical protein
LIKAVSIFSLLVIAFSLVSPQVAAEWTGVWVDIGETTTDLQFESTQRTMRSDSLNLHIEEKTASDLRVGLSLGISDIRTTNKIPPDNTQKFEGGHFGFYLRFPQQLNKHLSWQASFSYRYNYADDSSISMPSELEWRETRAQFGLGLKFTALRITPFVSYRDISGDISNDTSTESFETVDNNSQGISFDFYTEPTAFIRLQLLRGGEEGGYLTFARVY